MKEGLIICVYRYVIYLSIYIFFCLPRISKLKTVENLQNSVAKITNVFLKYKISASGLKFLKHFLNIINPDPYLGLIFLRSTH